MTTEQWERENQDTLMEYFIDGDPSVRRIQCEYCRKVIYTQARNRKYCSFQTCGHKMLNLRKSLKSVPNVERIPALAAGSSSYRFGQMPDIAAMPVGRKTTAIVKQPHTLLFEELDKVFQAPYPRSLLSRKSGTSHFGKCHFTVTPNRSLPNPQNGNLGDYLKSGYAFRNLICSPCRIRSPR